MQSGRARSGVARRLPPLRVVVRRQLFPNAESEWDRDALEAAVEVESGSFRGSFGTTLYGHELTNLRALLQTFLDQLGQHLKTSFALIERGVEFEFELFRRGAVAAQVTLHTDEADYQQLTFPMEIDPTQLSTCIAQIDAVLARFPPIVATTSGPDGDISPG